MYEKYYGLAERPFDLTPNWRYLYLTPTHREALTAIQYGISARRGIVVVLGEAGTGKTTIVRSAIRALKRSDVRHVYLTNPMLTRAEFLKFLSQAFRLDPSTADCKVDLIRELTNQLKRQHSAGKATVLIVDEAQSMPHELLEEIRLLANIETPSAKLLQVVLLGQPELADRLNDPSLRQLKQRIAIRCALKPLDLKSTAAMIAGRIRVAGGKPAELFTSRAIELVYLHSAGVPRTINVICDNALLSGYAADVRPIGGDIIEEVCREFDLPRRSDLTAPESARPQTMEHDSAASAASKAAPEAVAAVSSPASSAAVESAAPAAPMATPMPMKRASEHGSVTSIASVTNVPAGSGLVLPSASAASPAASAEPRHSGSLCEPPSYAASSGRLATRPAEGGNLAASAAPAVSESTSPKPAASSVPAAPGLVSASASAASPAASAGPRRSLGEGGKLAGSAAPGKADQDLFSNYGKPRRFSLLSWVRG